MYDIYGKASLHLTATNSRAAERIWLSNGHPGRRYLEIKEAASLWLEGVGGIARRCGFPTEMHGMRTSDYDCTKAGREECERHYQTWGRGGAGMMMPYLAVVYYRKK